MQHLTPSDAPYFFLFCLTAFVVWRVAVMLATGNMRLYGGVSAATYATRETDPRRFWMNLAVHVAVIALLSWDVRQCLAGVCEKDRLTRRSISF